MKKPLSVWGIRAACLSLVLVAQSCWSSPRKGGAWAGDVPEGEAAEVSAKAEPSIPSGARALMLAYPGFIGSYSDNKLVFLDGSTLEYDDGISKTYLERLDNSDPEDMFADRYYTGPVKEPQYCYDPGRGRCEALFKKMYGGSEAEVRKHLADVTWFGQKLKFTTVNAAADSLRAVEADILRNHPSLQKYFAKSSTFYWRQVRGAQRLSAHSYGMTIDICVEYSNYWRWSNPGKDELDTLQFQNRIPDEIIMCFERHGFISGAKWYHFDTMHFEFRPELLYHGRE